MPNISTLGAALDQIAQLKMQQFSLNTLSTQLATGKKTQEFSGLGTDVLASKRARANIGALEGYSNNITNANRRMDFMLTSIKEIQTQAETVVNGITTATQNGDYPDQDIIKDLAANVYDFISTLINTQDGDRYLFAGADSATKPFSDTGLFQSFLGEFLPDETDLTNPPLVASGAIGQWGDGTITTDQFIASYRGVNETTIGYSASLASDTAGKVFVRADENADFDYTVLADTPGIKEILTALNVLQALPPPQYAPGALNDPTATTFANDVLPFPPAEKQENFFKVINDLGTLITGAIDKLDDERFKLSQVQAQVTLIKDTHNLDTNTFKNIIAETEDVDITEISVRITQLQTQLQASYSVTALISQLTLANFISA